MTPTEASAASAAVASAASAAVLAERLGDAVTTEETFGLLTADVALERWVDAATAARDDLGCTFFDFLAGVDELEEGFSIVAHVWNPVEHRHLLLRTRAPREPAVVPTITGVYRGANWHERETFEMFGVIFDGHPNLVRLLTPDSFEGHPLRKDFVLASRAMKEWPGAKEPGESAHEGAPSRRRMRPPGQPDPEDWGPDAQRGGAGASAATGAAAGGGDGDDGGGPRAERRPRRGTER